MNKSRQLLVDIMLVVVLCVAAIMAEVGTKRNVDQARQLVIPTAGLGAVLIVGLLIVALKQKKDGASAG